MTLPKHQEINILAVDDRQDGLLAIEAVLNSPDYNVVLASSGEEAVSRLLQYDFAVILLDVQMPVMDGFQTAKKIKENEDWKHIPIIFLTAINKEVVHIYRGYECGAVDYLFKPFDPNLLKSKVAVFVDLFLKNQKIKQQADLLRISERREHERDLARFELENLRRYRNLANAIPHIIWKGKIDGSLDYCNQVWYQYTGFTSERSQGTGWQSAIDTADQARFLSIWNEAMGKAVSFETECRIMRFDGVSRWHLVRVTIENLKDGIGIGWIGSCTDIHDRKQAEEELQKIREDLEERVQERTLELFQANQTLQLEMAERLKAQKEILQIRDQEQKRIGQDLHDGLAQQLAGLSFMSKVLEQKLTAQGRPEAEQATELINLIKEAINETRRLARGFYPIELERHGLLSALEEFAVNTRQQFDIACECDFEDSVEIADKNLAIHLYRISQEAVHNAIKHGKAKKVLISMERSNGHIVFSVKDDGVGIQDSKREGMGIRTMNYRARMIGASFSVQRQETGGTLVSCKLKKEAAAVYQSVFL